MSSEQMVWCRVAKLRGPDDPAWFCAVFHRGKPVEWRDFPTWAEAYRYAREQAPSERAGCTFQPADLT